MSFTKTSPLIPIASLARLVAACLALVVSAHAATFTVNTTADEFDTPSGANLSLREAARDAGALAGDDTIVFAAALSGQTITLTLGSEIFLGNGVTIDASSLAAGVTIDGGPGSNRIFSTLSTVSLIGLTLTGGNGVGGLSSSYGGAIFSKGSTLTLTRCTLTGNSATQGGGLYGSGSVTVDACTFVGNTATDEGGGFTSGGGATVTRSTFSGNTANGANSGGGAVDSNEFSSSLTLENCTIIGNSAPGATAIGGGVRREAGTVTIKNCIVAGNTAGTAGSENLGGTITQTGANITTGAPLVAPLGNYGGSTQTRPPLAGSPAIDAAVGSTFTTDQRGVAIVGLPDIGAVENGSRVTTATDQLDTPVGADVALREAIRDCPNGGVVDFAPALSGGTCTLTTALGGEIVIAKNLTIDANNLTAGITIDGGAGTNRIFYVNSGQAVSLIGLTLTGGNGVGTTSFSGGAIHNAGSLSMTRCTVSGSTASNGGGLWNASTGTATVDACTFIGNTAAAAGGGISSQGTVTVTRSTFSGNVANGTGVGGGAVNCTNTAASNVALENCTLVGNSAPGPSGIGGGVRQAGGTVTVKNCIVAGNTATTPGTENLAGTITQTGANITTGDPLLSPLGNYGGPTQTRPPLPGSPAIDAAVGSPFTTDQRGCPIFGVADIGAAEGVTVVDTGTDELDAAALSGTGISLREAVRDTPAGGAIVFAPALSGGACTLTTALGGEIVLSKNMTIDANSLAAGITIDGGAGTNRIFSVTGLTTSVALRSLTLTCGNGEGASKSGGGGAIWTEGLLDLDGCTLHGNSASISGGAIHKTNGTLSLSRCTLSGNSSVNGGVLSNTGTLSITHSTLSGNTATNSGGAILQSNGTLTLTHSIVAGNTAPTGGDIRNTATVIRAGANVVQSFSGTAASGPAAINAAPLLAPLANYGGPAQTMALKPGSPALNAAVGSASTSDQRGFPIVGVQDIGAYEAGTTNTFSLWAIENAGSAVGFGSDEEMDGAVNGLEYATRRNPLASDTPLSPVLAPDGSGHSFQFRYRAAATDLRYIVQRSPDLALPGSGWVEIYRYDSSTGLITETGVNGSEDPGTQLINLIDPTLGTQAFWRLVVERVP